MSKPTTTHPVLLLMAVIATFSATSGGVAGFANSFHHKLSRRLKDYDVSLNAEIIEGDSSFDRGNWEDTASNEWGIPCSKNLPPLYNRKTKPMHKSLPNGGKVTLVGSGPGDPDLLTLSAYKLLTEAVPGEEKLVIADRLVSPEILSLINCEVKVARKLPGCAELAQEEIYWWTYQALNQGKHVIRLKIGDPFVFGRGGEEVLTFRRFGVEASVIPVRAVKDSTVHVVKVCFLNGSVAAFFFSQGVSAAFSAPLLGAIPVTHRGVANQVVMCTGYGREGSSPDLIRYHPEQTIVFLMAVGRLQQLCDRLVESAGYPIDTPVAIVEKAGCPNQRTVVGNMKTIAHLAELHNVRPPSTIVVGQVVNVLLEQNDETGEYVTGLIQQMNQEVF